ncbi:putative hydrolase [Planctomycetes bacterium Poly30]|uniref:Putative hydrolase n=1 Tax=Saltatorellus ferox TaxID=2528018 RepID=A0A518EPG6_9BACT|nr:putative hydrolase [Planctomycetes bacterium Poly30]
MPAPVPTTNSIQRHVAPLRAPIWARGGHAQTLLAYTLRAPGEALVPAGDGRIRFHEVPVTEGDRLVIVDAAPLSSAPLSSGPLSSGRLDGVAVHLMHGLTGSTDSNYMRMCAAVLRRHGARVIGFNHRGQGPGAGLAKRLYHSGSFPDLWAAVGKGRALHPDLLHLAVGFSLSANTALLGVTEKGDASDPASLPDGVLAVNPPVDLRACAIRIETGVNRLYDRNFVRGMRESVAARRSRGWLPDSVMIPKGASVRGADEAVTAPQAGYGSADEYYADCSSGPRLATLRRPAVILSADDDPFIAPEDITSAARGTAAFVHLEPVGGHLGYLSQPTTARVAGLDPAGELRGLGSRWLAGAVLHYCEQLVLASADQSRSMTSTSAPDAPG